ncbi:hypothetical protein N7466_007073 [Penicillium verhagenii]|uniref:uncharacterized protein n=1 Tax=Penicillium verhagenii TaxID=1562060 RepID=UPI002545949D|nr:uncharacterized protein N7466_007073 [Penicillium verhagenii]KAJ5928117.1 hypothetical protein N7466_007073 [Penicillium verhagenii]
MKYDSLTVQNTFELGAVDPSTLIAKRLDKVARQANVVPGDNVSEVAHNLARRDMNPENMLEGLLGDSSSSSMVPTGTPSANYSFSKQRHLATPTPTTSPTSTPIPSSSSSSSANPLAILEGLLGARDATSEMGEFPKFFDTTGPTPVRMDGVAPGPPGGRPMEKRRGKDVGANDSPEPTTLEKRLAPTQVV